MNEKRMTEERFGSFYAIISLSYVGSQVYRNHHSTIAVSFYDIPFSKFNQKNELGTKYVSDVPIVSILCIILNMQQHLW